jgi:Uroporphyrinogen-III methylase
VGRVFIVGAGPGDPELITLKGLRLIETADAIVYDRLVPQALLSRARPQALLVYVGKKPGGQGGIL